MTTKNNYASYIDSNSIHNIVDPKNSSPTPRTRIKGSLKNKRLFSLRSIATSVTALFAVLFILISSVPGVTAMVQTSQSDIPNRGSNVSVADAFPCSTSMGYNMDKKGGWENIFTGVPLSDTKNRTWTLQEAIGSYPAFVSYHGEGEPESKILGMPKDKEPNDYSEKIVNKDDADVIRNFSACSINGIAVTIANGIIGMSGAITGMAQFFAVTAFDPDFICASPQKNSPDNAPGCVNLISIIGGSGSGAADDTGIIGVLTDGIYFSLIILVVAAAAFWVAYRGIVKRQLREALWGTLWIFLSVIIGVMFLSKPALLVSAPMKVSNVVSSCVMGAFSAENCFSGKKTNAGEIMADDSSSLVCNSVAPGSGNLSRQMKMSVNNMTCNIWKAFVLNPYSVGEFGDSYDEFESKSAKFGAVIAKEDNNMPDDITPETYCISLTASQSYDEMKGGAAYFDGTKNICNLVAYELFLQNNLEMNDDSGSKQAVEKINGKSDSRWYNVVYAAQSTSGMWENWTGGFNKIGAAGLSFVLSIAGTVIIFITSLMALVFFLTSAILMSFAPLFLLFGVHPGRGKSIMLGWLEKVVSNVLKYIASAIFLVITIAMYSALLKNISNLGVTVLLVIIVSIALFLYRKEIIDMIGKVNMGGEQMSSKFTDTIGGKAKKYATKGQALAVGAAGGALGAKIAGGSGKSGFKDGFSRELKKGQGIVSNTMRQVDRNSVARRQQLGADQRNAEIKAKAAEDLAENKGTQLNVADHAVAAANADFSAQNATHNDLGQDMSKLEDAQKEALSEFSRTTKAQLEDTLKRNIDLSYNKKVTDADAERRSGIATLDAQLTNGVIDKNQYSQKARQLDVKYDSAVNKAQSSRDSAMDNIGSAVTSNAAKIDDFAIAKEISHELDKERANIVRAEASGDLQAEKEARVRASQLEKDIEAKLSDISEPMQKFLDKEMNKSMQTAMNNNNIARNVGDISHEQFAQSERDLKEKSQLLNDEIKKQQQLSNEHSTLLSTAQNMRSEAEIMREVSDSFNPGDLVTDKTVEKRMQEKRNKPKGN